MIGPYELELVTPGCHPGAEIYSAKAYLKDDIDEVLPYLNAVWEGAVYSQQGEALTWRMDGRAVAVRPHELSVGGIRDRNEAVPAIEELIRQIEAVWARRVEIEPSYHRREPPKTLDVYRLLPGGNCRECGQLTCMAFAMEVIAGELELSQCQPLFDGCHDEEVATLQILLAWTG
jgi:ArsR family metal-binding transcriptional regulator